MKSLQKITSNYFAVKSLKVRWKVKTFRCMRIFQHYFDIKSFNFFWCCCFCYVLFLLLGWNCRVYRKLCRLWNEFRKARVNGFAASTQLNWLNWELAGCLDEYNMNWTCYLLEFCNNLIFMSSLVDNVWFIITATIL